MATATKGKSPFHPGQPVPVELFVGRASQIDRIMKRGAGQVAEGKPVAIFVQGEYGIGKSSLAGFVMSLAEQMHSLHGIYAPLGGANNLVDLATAVLQASVRSGVFDPGRSERIREWLAKYIGKQQFLGLTLNMEALRKDAPNLSNPFAMLEFLNEALRRLGGAGVKGIFLILDEINGVTSDPQFSHFIKGIVDTNAMAREPLPLLLMLCAVEERRREMIQSHQPVDRIFDVVEIDPMSVPEMEEFFTRAFGSVKMSVNPDALSLLVHYSAGFPKIMHLIGDAAYWLDQDGTVDRDDALRAILAAANEVGEKFVDQQVYKALRSADYHSILAKIAKMGPDVMTFTKAQVKSDLTDSQKRKFNNFLQKMKRLNVVRSGDVQGEYIFNMRMVRLYIWLQSVRVPK